MQEAGPIGVFDSGYGGLTVFKELVKALPQYDFVYLGDNARVPYGTRSFESVYKYTWECVQALFAQKCNLVVLACNTASAKALRSIQQINLGQLKEAKKVLGVIRPTTEIAGRLTQNGHLGIFATEGTVKSDSYGIEIDRFFPDVIVSQEACPMWVPLVENGHFASEAADVFVKEHIDKLLSKDPDIDSVVLACTHYPLLAPKIRAFLPEHIQIVSQGTLVADSLVNYLKRHTEVDARCTQNGERQYYTTDCAESFSKMAEIFLGEPIKARKLNV